MRSGTHNGKTSNGTSTLNRLDLLRLVIAMALILAGGTTWRYSHAEAPVHAETTVLSQDTQKVLGPFAL